MTEGVGQSNVKSNGDLNRLQRIVAQQIKSWQLAGVTDVPKVDVSLAAVDVAGPANAIQGDTAPQQSVEQLQTVEEPQAIELNLPTEADSSDDQRSLTTTDSVTSTSNSYMTTELESKGTQDVAKSKQTESDKTTTPKKSEMTIAERREELTELAACVADCKRCPELASTRTQTVFGVGKPNAKIMFVGEAPGADEDAQGIPFVGRAGKLLDKIIVACQLTRDEIYICNILRCRPPGNRNPSTEEAVNCREFLDSQIRIVDPDYIVCWGSVAARNLLDTQEAIGKMRGQFFELGRAKVLCTYHPSYLLRNPPAKKEVWKDMKFLMRDMGVDLDTSM